MIINKNFMSFHQIEASQKFGDMEVIVEDNYQPELI